MSIRTLIIDDEPHAIAVIENYAKNIPELQVKGSCRNAIEALQQLQGGQFDLVFLDIKMPGVKGTELVKSLKKPPMVVFTTAYEEYAAEGFDLDAVDYLVKPISRERFKRAVEKVIFTHRGQSLAFSQSAQATPHVPEHYLYMRIERRTTKIKTTDILWIESIKDYIRIVLPDKMLVTKQKISIIEKLLPLGEFARIHRSFIVPVDKISAYHPNYILIGTKELPVGRNYKQALQDMFIAR